MDAVWKIEDKTKMSTAGAVTIFACIAFLLLLTCTGMAVMVMKRISTRNRRLVMVGHHDPCSSSEEEEPRAAGCSPIQKVLMKSIRWSNSSKWHGEGSPPESLLVEAAGMAVRRSHNSTSPVWQRPILMGEKCELPRFSGVILYDENGRSVNDRHEITEMRRTLKDFLI